MAKILRDMVGFVNKTSNKKASSAESIARMVDQGKDVSKFFTNDGRIRRPLMNEIDVGAEEGNSVVPAAPSLRPSAER